MLILKKIKIKQCIAFVLVLTCFLSFSQTPLYAQFDEDPFAEDPFSDEADFEDLDLDGFRFEEDEGSFEGIGEDGFGVEDTEVIEEDSGEYIDENVLSDDTQQLLQQALLRRRDLLAEEKANFGFNVAYGVGTGVLIGGWFALLFGTTSRDTLRSLGLGIVLGGLMGSVIGGRSVLAPRTLPNGLSSLEENPLIVQHQLKSSSDFNISFQWNF